MALAEEVLENAEAARAWLSEPQAALGGRVPMELLATDEGGRQVEDLLLRMQHGYLA
ncbi:MAG: antitoxin Xre/MbcA/ParS toxin-binding domain-containing protein [Burkholderiales bacterium]